MSKKNSKATRARILAADLAREKALAARRATKAAKRAARAAVAGGTTGAAAKRKVKGVRVKKGVRIKGIKVVDAESKKAAIAALRAAAADAAMDTDAGGVKKQVTTAKQGAAAPVAMQS